MRRQNHSSAETYTHTFGLNLERASITKTKRGVSAQSQKLINQSSTEKEQGADIQEITLAAPYACSVFDELTIWLESVQG